MNEFRVPGPVFEAVFNAVLGYFDSSAKLQIFLRARCDVIDFGTVFAGKLVKNEAAFAVLQMVDRRGLTGWKKLLLALRSIDDAIMQQAIVKAESCLPGSEIKARDGIHIPKRTPRQTVLKQDDLLASTLRDQQTASLPAKNLKRGQDGATRHGGSKSQRAYKGRPAGRVKQDAPLQHVWLSRSWPFLDREEILSRVHSLCAPGVPYVLVVEGPRRCGKSHSRRFLKHLHEQSFLKESLFEVRVESPAEAPDFTRSRLLEAIALELGLDGIEEFLKRHSDMTHRWEPRAVGWLRGRIKEKKHSGWLVLDGFDDQEFPLRQVPSSTNWCSLPRTTLSDYGSYSWATIARACCSATTEAWKLRFSAFLTSSRMNTICGSTSSDLHVSLALRISSPTTSNSCSQES